MTWTLFNLQLFLTQLLQDLCSFGGTSSKDLTTLVSHLWLQGTFYNLTPDKLISLLSFSTLFYILMNTVPPQIQATTNLGPFSPRPDWPLPVSLTITALLILILAIGLVTVSLRTGHLPFVFPWVSPALPAGFHSEAAVSSALPN